MTFLPRLLLLLRGVLGVVGMFVSLAAIVVSKTVFGVIPSPSSAHRKVCCVYLAALVTTLVWPRSDRKGASLVTTG